MPAICHKSPQDRHATGAPPAARGAPIRDTARRFGAEGTDMKTKLDADNTELDRDFEPLRVALALGALVLGVLFGLH